MKIKIQDINTNYIQEGTSGSNILLLHGWGANLTLFDNMINHLSINHKVYALDMPGFGYTEEPSSAWNVDKYVDFVMDFISAMDIKKLSILGHSFGGRVIIKMVTRENLPFDIDKLILVDSAGIKPEISKKASFKTRVYKLLKILVNNKLILRLFPNALNNLKKRFGSTDYKNASPIMRDALVKTVNEDLKPLLPKIKYSTLLIWGEKDTATPIQDAKVMESLIPNAGIVEIKNAGHYSYLEQPNLVNRVLDSFLCSKGDN